MDILIPNLELPLEERIQLSIYPNGLVVNHSTLDANNKRKAVALPSHGRLIDADEFKASIHMNHLGEFATNRDVQVLYKLLNNAETIVEATE